MQVRHFQIQENTVKLLLVHAPRSFLAITDLPDIRLQGPEYFGHQFKASRVILYYKQF